MNANAWATDMLGMADAGPTLAITLGAGLTRPRGRSEEIEPSQLPRTIAAHGGAEAWWSGAVFVDGHRAQSRWQATHAVGIDIDHREAHAAFAQWRQLPATEREASKLAPMPWTTARRLHRALSTAPATHAHMTLRGARLVAVLSRPITDAEEHARVARELCRRAEAWLVASSLADELEVDTAASCDRARLFFAPRAQVDGRRRLAVVHQAGAGVVDVDETIAELDERDAIAAEAKKVAPSPTMALPRVGADAVSRARAWLARAEPAVAGQHGHDRTFAVVERVVRGFDLDDAQAFDVLGDWNARCDPPWSDKELRRKITEGRAKGDTPLAGLRDAERPEAPRAAVHAPTGADGSGVRRTGRTAKRTDVANAETLVELHTADLRYVAAWRKWLAWDGTRWRIDDNGGALRHAVDAARVMCERALQACNAVNERIAREGMSDALEETKKEADRDLAWAANSQNARRLTAMLEVARAFDTLAVTHDKLDDDPWVLNVINGTLDLRTGRLRPHRREDLLTRLAPVVYDPTAACPAWSAFVERAMGGDAELVAYLRRIVGYALTGSVQEHVLGFFFGGGANGKSTFLGAIHAMLGDYATPASRNLLFRGKGDRHATELATLLGRRFVTCSEIGAGQVFDEALVKDLTGGDPINCRRMREDEWTFTPTHKLFIAGNHKPIVRGDDEGIWRRLRLIPWDVTIPEPERDKALPERLRREFAGILAWAVAGCLEWLRDGLGDPPAVVDATAAFRVESDVLGQFFAERAIFEPDARVPRKDFRQAYEVWCGELGHEPAGARRLGEALRLRGVSDGNVREGLRTVNGWRGVRLSTAEDRANLMWNREDTK